MRQKKNSPKKQKRTLKNPFGKLFRDPAFLEAALTHPSYRGSVIRKNGINFQRLEFLGDTVLGLVVSHKLFRENPKAQEGELSYERSLLVSKKELSRQALRLELGRWLKLSGQRTPETSPKILADALEALIGALFLDQGLEAARKFIEKIFSKAEKSEVSVEVPENPKGLLQEWVQRRWKTLPEYETVPHKKGFHSTVITPHGRAIGIAKSKKESQEAAAVKILPRLKKFLEKKSD